MGSANSRRAASRRIFAGPTISLAMRMSRMPAAASTSASPSLAQVTPKAPASRSRRASAGVLIALVWGRHPTPASLTMIRRIVAMLRASLSRSTSKAGVSRSATGRPAPAGPVTPGPPASRASRLPYFSTPAVMPRISFSENRT